MHKVATGPRPVTADRARVQKLFEQACQMGSHAVRCCRGKGCGEAIMLQPARLLHRDKKRPKSVESKMQVCMDT